LARGDNEKRVYRAFSDTSEFFQTPRVTGLASSEVSRCNQYVSKMMVGLPGVPGVPGA
jgi:hypothetical protein